MRSPPVETPIGRRYDFAWVATGTSVVKTFPGPVYGRIQKVITQPLTLSSAYDLKILGLYDVDILAGAGATRSQTASEVKYIYANARDEKLFAFGDLQLQLTSVTSGNSGLVAVYMYPLNFETDYWPALPSGF